LFHRLLDPRNRPKDRGTQRTSIEFTTTEPADLTLIANPGIHNDAQFDWAFWGTVTISDLEAR
jgi:hypothetical protein